MIASMSSGSYLPHDGDYDDNVANALNNQLSSDNTSTPSVYGYSLIGGRGRPVYSIHHPTALLLGVDPRGVLTSAQTTLMAGSSNNLVETVVEGFIPTVTCTPLSTLEVFSSSASDPAKVTYSFTFPCGNKTAAYTLANPIVVDVHACMNGDPLIYVFALAPKQDQVRVRG